MRLGPVFPRPVSASSEAERGRHGRRRPTVPCAASGALRAAGSDLHRPRTETSPDPEPSSAWASHRGSCPDSTSGPRASPRAKHLWVWNPSAAIREKIVLIIGGGGPGGRGGQGACGRRSRPPRPAPRRTGGTRPPATPPPSPPAPQARAHTPLSGSLALVLSSSRPNGPLAG
jgi:hypothetical protein